MLKKHFIKSNFLVFFVRSYLVKTFFLTKTVKLDLKMFVKHTLKQKQKTPLAKTLLAKQGLKC